MQSCTSTVGRRYQRNDGDLPFPDPFLDDHFRIIGAKSRRRQAKKAQVSSSPLIPHVRTRLTHTDGTAGVAVYIAKNLEANVYLCLAGGTGHDIGHTPHGHRGEEKLVELSGKPFRHNVNSVFIAQHIERGGRGLNLNFETLEAMLYHSRGSGELVVSAERYPGYTIVMYSDKMDYTFSDINDAIRTGYLDLATAPSEFKEALDFLGESQRERTLTTANALIEESKRKDRVIFSEGEVFEAFDIIRKHMYKQVYPKAANRVQSLSVEIMYGFFAQDPEFLGEYQGLNPVIPVTLLTDEEANHAVNLRLRSETLSIRNMGHFGVFEVLNSMRANNIDFSKLDYTKPDLEWGTSRYT
jgi:dGTPase